MKQEQALRIQRELLREFGGFPNGEPFLRNGIWAFPFIHGGTGLHVFLVDRPITSELDHERAKREGIEKLRERIDKPDAV